MDVLEKCVNPLCSQLSPVTSSGNRFAARDHVASWCWSCSQQAEDERSPSFHVTSITLS